MTLALLRSQLRYDLRAKYSGAALGAWWAVFQPLLLVATYTFVFGLVFKQRRPEELSGVPATIAGYLLFLLSGTVPWISLQEGISDAMESIVRNEPIVKSVVYPLEVLPLSGALTSLVTLGVGLVTTLVVSLIAGVLPTWRWFLLPLPIALQLTIAVGVGKVLCCAVVALRDVRYLVSTALFLGYFLTPILYLPQSVAGSPWISFGLAANPLTHLVALYRALLLGTTFPSWAGCAWLAAFTLAAAWAGRRQFARWRNEFEAFL